MKLEKLPLYIALVLMAVSCTKWELPEKCAEALPTDISISAVGNTVTASAGISSATWSLVNASGTAVNTASDTSYSFTSTTYPNGSYTIKAGGKNACGFSFSLQKAYSICTDVVPTDISISTNGNIVTSTIGGLTADWSLVNASGTTVNTASGTSYSFTTTTYPNGSYTIKANGKTACNTPFNLTKPYTINTPTSTSLVEMVNIPGGTFEMGDTRNEGFNSEKPVHTVTVSGFKIGKYEITQKQYQTVMGTNPSLSTNCDDCPLENISWLDAVAFCNALSDRESRQKVYTISGTTVSSNLSANGYRLPTEAEWEYAAGGGSSNRTRFGNGKDIADPAEMNFDGRASSKTSYSVVGEFRDMTIKTGSFAPNSLGLYDLSGNVWEWCNDWYSAYTGGAQTNPTGAATGSNRVIRGGGWLYDSVSSRVAYRTSLTPWFRTDNVGFRVVSLQ
ncbi:MAG: formylglycine-generating enzyme family protein [Spirosomataceae bacterium]